MKTITYSTARKNLAKTMELVHNNRTEVIITKKNDISVVMVSLEEYESLKETSYLLKSPKNAKRLFESIQEIENDQGFERELIEWN